MANRLGGFDAWLIGVAAMLGAGVFAVFGPVFALVNNWLWLAVLLAAAVATLNSISVAWLASRFPSSGAGYRYSTEVLGPTAGFITGLAFLIGKSGSVAAAALVIASAFATSAPGLLAVLVIALAVLLNYFGISATARGVRFLAIPTLAILIALLITAHFALPLRSPVDPAPAVDSAVDPAQLLAASALMFFAFAGYARIATLAAEVREPARTVPRAMLLALASVMALYLGFAFVLPTVLGEKLAADSNALLALAIELDSAWPILVRSILLLAAGASLLVLLAGLSRTSQAMAADRQLPQILASQSRFGSPWLAELSFGALAAVIAISGQVLFAISVSACLVLLYYAFAHLAVLRHSRQLYVKLAAGIGILSCLALSISLNAQAIILSFAALLFGLLLRQLIAKFRGVD